MSIASLPLIDLCLIVFVLAFVMVGFWFGFVHTVGSVVGLFGGAVAAGLLYPHLGAWLADLGMSDETARLAAFLLLLILVSRLFGWAFGIVDRIFRLTAVIPFVKAFDRLLGAILGLVEGLVALGALAFFASRFPAGEALQAALTGSILIRPFAFIGGILAPFLPEAVRALTPLI